MFYRLESTEDLFNRWRSIEQDLGVELLSSTFQNRLLTTTLIMNEVMSSYNEQLKLLQFKAEQGYIAPKKIEELNALLAESLAYLHQVNQEPITQAEFDDFSNHCKFKSTRQAHIVLGDSTSIPEPPEVNLHCEHMNQPCDLDTCPFVTDPNLYPY